MELGDDLELDVPADKPKKRPWLQRHYGELKERLGPAATVLDTALFVLSLLYLSWFVNAATPWDEPFALAWALPSPTVILIVVLFAVSAWFGRRPYGFIMPALALFILLPIRLFRWADLVALSSFGRPVAGTDAASLGDLMLFISDVVPFATLATWLFVLVVGLGLAVFVAKQTLSASFNYLVPLRHRLGFVGVVVVLGLLSLLIPSSPGHFGAFAEARGRRLLGALGEAWGGAPDAEDTRAEILARGKRLNDAAAKLDLDKRDVLFLVLPSYGDEVFRQPHRAALDAERQVLAASLKSAGYHIRSHRLRSPVRGAQSELAHATFISGTRADVPDHLDLFRAEEPTTLATIFGRSGYTTLHVMPSVTREGPLDPFRYFGFFTTYRAWELGYRGPMYAWVSVPDQYTLDIMHRRELSHATRPVFMQMELVGMRPPWTEQPPYVEDWSTLEDGLVFETLPAKRFDVEGVSLTGAVPAYQHAVRHTWRVLREYLTKESLRPPPKKARRRRRRPAPLYVLVGDHPPLAQASPAHHAPDGTSPLPSEEQVPLVPVHVLSRDEAVLEPFAARGYVEGLSPPAAGHLLMETFAHFFAEDFGVPPEGDAP